MPDHPAPAPEPRTGSPGRNAAIEWLRALSILYIVAYWHLLGYAPAIRDFKNPVNSRITVVVLALFLFVSGHLIGRGLQRSPGVRRFYQRRLVRIYPPYLLALLLFEASGLLWRNQFLESAVLISALTGDPPLTLWFITVLMVDVLLAPWLLLLRRRVNPAGSRSGDGWLLLALLVLPLLLAWLVQGPDPRLFFYFPAFAAGLLAPLPGPGDNRAGRLALLGTAAGLAGGLVLSISAGGVSESNMAHMPLTLFGAWFLVLATNRLLAGRRTPWLIAQLGLASYFMYLFHRPLFKLFTGWFMPGSAGAQLAWLLLGCVPLIALISWAGQIGYDALVTRLQTAGRPDPAATAAPDR
ncbi:acyltransferase [Synechococcus sp. RSCCF101]|uniref:acyltransferase family protein n=1 Tax=Synechococcus sp. RSCCF101 TaxID=2511069 RepID=UPI001247B127|nr:acyltransferase [Synechococcus sp. RSCCF101]QEY32433.1 acyltransferase [Synechococcus sp. RSCCF101]